MFGKKCFLAQKINCIFFMNKNIKTANDNKNCSNGMNLRKSFNRTKICHYIQTILLVLSTQKCFFYFHVLKILHHQLNHLIIKKKHKLIIYKKIAWYLLWLCFSISVHFLYFVLNLRCSAIKSKPKWILKNVINDVLCWHAKAWSICICMMRIMRYFMLFNIWCFFLLKYKKCWTFVV